MEEICLITYGDATDKTTWSGTPLRMYEYFSKCGDIMLTTFNMKNNFKKYMNFSYILGRFVYRRNTLRDPFLYSITSNAIAKFTKEHGDKNYLFIAEHTLNNHKNENGKYYLYLDSLLRPYHLYDERKMKPLAKQFLKKYEENDRKCFFEYDGIFTQNQWSKDFLINEYDIDSGKIYNVGFGINAQYYDGPKDYSNKQLMIVLRRGTEYVKGLYLLLEAFKIARKTDSELKLKVFGTTCEDIDGVEYFENQPRELMLDAYKESSLFVLPNVLEPNGVSYLEALANKTPIVGLNRFSFPEFSGHGKYGFICDIASPEKLAYVILDALSNPIRLKKMGEEGKAFVQNRYDWNIVLKKIKNVMI